MASEPITCEEADHDASIRCLLEDMHEKMQFLCEEIAKGRAPPEAEGPAKSVLRSCSTLRTLSPSSGNSGESARETRRATASRALSGGLVSVFDSEGGASRTRAQSEQEEESLVRRLERLEQRSAQLDQLRLELREQLLSELRPELEAEWRRGLQQVEHLEQRLTETLQLSTAKMGSSHRFHWEDQAVCDERLEATRLGLAKLDSEQRAQAELLDFVRQQVSEMMRPPAMERCKVTRGRGNSPETKAVEPGQLRSILGPGARSRKEASSPGDEWPQLSGAAGLEAEPEVSELIACA
ncbi:unnamed protein product [Effrenium voratum]|uniref:Uncharacterized protein n=1 Tax=Effrenium voratum TaxID=2562239 RepID=A0AA36JGP1_9DINO|nr:unnamed protein product [Effrenium voratum]